MRIFLAFRAFFAILFNPQLAAAVDRLLSGEAVSPEPVVSQEQATATPTPEPTPQPKPTRSDALTLLATLQREARFVDIVKEPLGNYSDEQVGAAARDVLRDCQTVIDRLFAIQPVVEGDEGTELETSADFDAGRYRLTGNVTGDAPYRGQLVHHGWEATRCELPQWTGSQVTAMVVAPIELEIR